jgi:hypothetical protein
MMKQSLSGSPAQSPVHRPGAEVPEPSAVPATPFPNPGKIDPPVSQPNMGKDPASSPMSPEKLPFPATPPPAKTPAMPVKTIPAGRNAAEPAVLSADGGLKLEALAWTSAPENRFVIINSQIVREGGMIEGAKVERIEKDHVVLLKDGKLYQLRHRAQR